MNVQYVLEKGVDEFPAVDEINLHDLEESDPGECGGSLSIYGMLVLGRMTGIMEVWVRDEETGIGVKKKESIVCLQKKKLHAAIKRSIKAVPNLDF